MGTGSTPDMEHFFSATVSKSDAETPRTNNDTAHRNRLSHNLDPSPVRSAEIYATLCGFQGVFLVQLDQLERGTCTVPLFSAWYAQAVVEKMEWFDVLCKFVVLVQSTLARFLWRLAHLGVVFNVVKRRPSFNAASSGRFSPR